MNSFRHRAGFRRARWVFGAALAVAVVGSGVAYATIPDSAGVIHTCYAKAGGTIRLIDTGIGQTCKVNEVALSWNQTGPAGPQGLKGNTGAAGPVGPAGAKGDTGAPGSTGAAGAKGDTGAPGSAGPTGAKGDTGAPGSAGAAGAKGDTGATGAPGAAGAKGDTGAPGPAGPTGAKGDTGDTGPAGGRGPIGFQGPKGDTGETGPSDVWQDNPSGVLLPANGGAVASVSLPAGIYVVSATAALYYVSSADAHCSLGDNEAGLLYASDGSVGGGQGVTLAVQGVFTLASSDFVYLFCASTVAMNAAYNDLVAIKVGTLH